MVHSLKVSVELHNPPPSYFGNKGLVFLQCLTPTSVANPTGLPNTQYNLTKPDLK